jgi:hypothetical protein
MKNLYRLSEKAIAVLRKEHVKGRLMHALGVKDPRTIEKYINNNTPGSPLMNYNLKSIIRDNSQISKENEIYKRLSDEEIAEWAEKSCEKQFST